MWSRALRKYPIVTCGQQPYRGRCKPRTHRPTTDGRVTNASRMTERAEVLRDGPGNSLNMSVDETRYADLASRLVPKARLSEADALE